MEEVTDMATIIIITTRSGSGNLLSKAKIDFFKEVNAEEARRVPSDRSIQYVIPKKEAGPYWTRLLKQAGKVAWLKVDFSKWKDEDESDDEAGGAGAWGGGGGMGGMGGMGGGDFESMMQNMGGYSGGRPDVDDLDDDEDEGDMPDLEDAGPPHGDSAESDEKKEDKEEEKKKDEA